MATTYEGAFLEPRSRRSRAQEPRIESPGAAGREPRSRASRTQRHPEFGIETRVPECATMVLRWLPVLCSLAAMNLLASETKKLTLISRQELYDRLANKHLLEGNRLEQLQNVPRGGVSPELLAKDCRSAFLNGRRASGLYAIQPKDSPPMAVYCDLRPDGGGWTLLQRNTRGNGVFSGPSAWSSYRSGFGNLTGDHWLGNELIYLLTRQNSFAVRFLLVDASGNEHRADYHSFRVDSEANGYALRLGDYSGDAGDAMTVTNETGTHDNMKFSTADRDNDRFPKNCAEEHGGGWWFDNCGSNFLNSHSDIYWRGLCGRDNPCIASSIMIQPGRKNCSTLPAPLPGDHYPIHTGSE
ncbi:fibrinogen-like protein 1-like protein [Spea bombifrons]|uniref:fibrinogen-like protein 1-like protein n=1 Tax=Spea bombifrons TaxID=233779 RepID=UPI00234A8D98|nr:fibrinogen-like protein 1-like protein [Spea bombifrons]